MSFKRSLSISSCSKQARSDKVLRSSKYGTCQVCGDKANIINYGALSCQSCKTFFRRNGFKPESVHPCLLKGSCEINMETRRNCTSCRLAKCFSVGMSSDLIRKEEKKKKNYASTSEFKTTKDPGSKSSKSPQRLLPLNELHQNQSLTNTEWTLISNITHAYDRFSTIPQICHTIENLSGLSNEIQSNENHAFEIVRLIYISMQSFIRSSPDFQILTASEQYSLFERNFHAISILCSVLVLHDAAIINKSKCVNVFPILCGQEKHHNKQLDSDSTILKLILIVLAFSSNCFIVDAHENMFNDSLLYGTHRLLGSQNVYIDLLWKYMIYRYDYYNSVLRFTRLIQLFLGLIKDSAMIYMNNLTYRKLVDNILEKIKQLLIIEQNEHVQLWGKS